MSGASEANRRDHVIVRAARSADAAGIAELDVRSWRAAYGDIFPSAELAKLSVEQRRASWERVIARAFGEQIALVAEFNGELVGVCQAGPARDAPEGVAEIYSLYVEPDLWGRGVGTALFDVALPWLAPSYEKATLWVVRENKKARRFYEARGFRWNQYTFKAIPFFNYLAQCVRYTTDLNRHFSYGWRQMYGG